MIVSNRDLVALGSAVKALPDGRLGGTLIRFNRPDKVKQYFTKATDFWGTEKSQTLPVLWYHGVKSIGPLRIGEASLVETESSIDIVASLGADAPDREKLILGAKAGKLGWSSGSSPYLIKVDGGGRIDQWPIIEASLAPITQVMDGGNHVIPLKALIGPAASPATIGELADLLEEIRSGDGASPSQEAHLKAMLARFDAMAGEIRQVLRGATTEVGASSSAPVLDLSDDDLALARAALALTE